MAFQKISSGQNLYPPITIPLAGGQTYVLDSGQGTVGQYGGSIGAQLTGYNLTGQYLLFLGPYCSLQMYDSAQQFWRNVGADTRGPLLISGDNANYRIANSTGCPVGAIVTIGLGALTNGFNTVTVTPTAGGSTWNTIVGGSMPSGLISITTAGSGYTKAPSLIFTPPGNQGSTPYIIPTAYAVLTGTSITSVTVLSVGAGLVAAPSITVIPAQGDTAGGGAVLTPPQSLTTGSLAAMWPITYGTPVTVAPTFTFTPASSITATAIMNFTVAGTSITVLSVVTAGASLGTSTMFQATACPTPPGFGALAGIVSNTYYDKNCIFPRPAIINGSVPAGALTQAILLGGSCSLTVADAGFGIQGTSLGFAPCFIQFAQVGGATSTIAYVAAPVGATNDQCILQPI